MGQNRKFEVLGWGLVINNDDHTAVICSDISSIGTANDAIEVRAFNPKSNIIAWADAHGIEILNPEALETAAPEMRTLNTQKAVNGEIIKPVFLEAAKLTFWQRWKLAIWLAAGSALGSVVYWVLAEVIDLF